MHCSSKKQPVENLTRLWSFIMKITAKENHMSDMQLSYKHWVSSKNRCVLDFKRMSATNEDFDSEEHYISLLVITCDLWCFSFRWVPLVPCRFRDYHSDLFQIFFVWNYLPLIVSVQGIAADHGPTVQLVDLGKEEWNDPLTIIVRSILARKGTAPDRVPNLG